MSKATPQPKEPASQSKVFAASLDAGKTGVVYRLPQELTIAKAVIERQAGRDIVVCGPDLQSNRQTAQQIEESVGRWVRGLPHASAGPAALPHYQPATPTAERAFVLRDADSQSTEGGTPTMKYFTPKLYRLGNTESSDVYDDFDLVWDEKIREYRKYLRSIKSQTPADMMRLGSKICLHDGEIVGVTKSSISVWLNEVLYSIEFDLDPSGPQPKHGPPISGHPFDTTGHCWLYDELELISPGVFQFEILISNGKILRFRCRDVAIRVVHQEILGRPVRGKLTLAKLQEVVMGSPQKVADIQKLRRIAKGHTKKKSAAYKVLGNAKSHSKNGRSAAAK
jgi:hypothetical protein